MKKLILLSMVLIGFNSYAQKLNVTPDGLMD